MNVAGILADAGTVADDTIQLRRRLHRHAELGLRLGPAHPNHSKRMLVNESALATGIAMPVAMARRFLDPSRRLTPGAGAVDTGARGR